ncbi:MAG: HNH endonuclease [Pirellulales bacterium]
MTKKDRMHNLVKAYWNPGDRFTIQQAYDLILSKSITSIKSTIQRELQELRDKGVLSFIDNNGTYERLPIGGEVIGDFRSLVDQAVRFSRIDFAGDDIAVEANRNRVCKDVAAYSAEKTAEDLYKIQHSIPSKTDCTVAIKTRIGQGFFREKLIRYWKKCAITGCDYVEILRASHIKPWRVSSDSERMNEYNGLLLMPNVDALFDMGMITIADSGVILKSYFIRNWEDDSLGINNQKIVGLDSRHKEFLQHHRNCVYLG